MTSSPMRNIDKQALREAAEKAMGSHDRLSVMPADDIFDISQHEGTQLDADIAALNVFNEAANPATVLALLDELEAAERRNAELTEKQCLIDICQGQGLEHRIAAERRAEAAEKRVAELEESHSQVIHSRDHYKRIADEGILSLAEARTLTVKLPEGKDSPQGWRVDPEFISKVQDAIGYDEECQCWEGTPSMEIVEAVLIAAAGIQLKVEE